MASPLPEAMAALWPGLACALGLVVGSFANVCIHRLPRRESVVRPRSRCPHCQAPITVWQNVPLLSWAVLRGRCRSCRAPISKRYPAVEAINGLAWLGLAILLGPTPQAVVSMALVSALLVLSLIDLEHFVLPDAITRPGIALGLACSLLPGPPSPLNAAGAAAGGYLAFLAIARAYRKTRGVEGLGQGDWKLVAMLGAFLGWQRMLLTVFLASVVGSVVGLALIALGRRSPKDMIPLGTFLGLAGILAVFAGDALVSWYRWVLGG